MFMVTLGTVTLLTLNSDNGRCADRPTERSSAGVLSSLRCCYVTECEVTGDHLSTSDGVSSSMSIPLEVRSTSYSSRQSDRARESDSVSSHDGGGRRGSESDGG